MANDDKGRRKWGDISQDIRTDSKLDRGRFGDMRGGSGNRAPPRAIYTPGSGPLKKTGRNSEEFDCDSIAGERPKPVSVQDRLRPMQFNSLAQGETSDTRETNERLSNLRLGDNRSGNDGTASLTRTNHPSGGDRRRSKKPEQQLYVPKKVQESLAERDVANRSPSRAPTPPQPQSQSSSHIGWDRERSETGNRDWDNQSNRSYRNDGQRNRSGRQQVGESSNNVRNRPDDHVKRFSGNRRGNNRNPNENEEREWRSNSPMSGRNYGNRREYPRELRQGSEPLAVTPNNANEYNRIRDTRSVDPPGYADKFQRKPPSGRRGSGKTAKIETLPPRFQRKYLAENGLDVPIGGGGSLFGKPTEDWDGGTVTFQGSSGYNNTSWTRNNMPPPSHPPPSHPPPPSGWTSTKPAGSRGRGRLRAEDLVEVTTANYRPGTPDQYSAASSRSHTPSQEYITRGYERRGSNSTMYTSMESLSRADTQVPMAPSSFMHQNINRSGRQSSPPHPPLDHQPRRNASPPASIPEHYNHQWQGNNNTEGVSSSADKTNSERYSLNPSPAKINEPYSSLPDLGSIATLNWTEDIDESFKENIDNKSDTEEHRTPSRSSSVISLCDNGDNSSRWRAPSVDPQGSSGRNSGFRKKRKDRRHSGATDRSCSRDNGSRGKSRERMNNQQNCENDSSMDDRRAAQNRRYEGNRRTRNGRLPPSREHSRDRDYHRGPSRNVEHTRRNDDENWRTGKRSSMCDAEDTRNSTTICNVAQCNTTNFGSLSNSGNANNPVTTSSSINKISSNSQPPGILVLPDKKELSPRNITIGGHGRSEQPAQQHQRKTLYDPNNPDRPIIVRTTANRASSLQIRDKNSTCQDSSSSLPTTSNSHSIVSPTGLQNFGNYRSPQLDSGIGMAGYSPARPSVPFVAEQIQANSGPAWYNPCSEVMRTAKDPYRLLEVETLDRELQWVLIDGGLITNWEKISGIRQALQKNLESLLETDIKFCQAENVEQHFWKILYYNMIEMLRKMMPKENGETRDTCKQIMLKIIDEGTIYFENLLTVLENKYKFKLEVFLASTSPPNGLGFVGLALVSAQKIFIFLGDLARYKEQANETTNYGKSRQWYLKAQQINPKNGRPYNQLALLAHYARRKLDAVYYYMRSLMASNPFHSARESLIALFDDNRKKYESTERKRKEEREWKERARMKEKEGANNAPGALRRETWIHPGGRRVRRTTSSTNAGDSKFVHSDSEELSQLTSVEVNKRFITSYLHVHGKLITKIGMETFQEAAIQMLREFRTLLQHSPLPIPETRLLQLLALNMFAIDTTQLKDSQMEQGYRSEVQERALAVSLQMFSLILERGVALLRAQFESDQRHRLIVDEDMQVLLPAIKIWCDWMLCHSTVWNPPPSCTDYRVGPPGDSWSRLAVMVNLLEMLEYSRQIVIQAKDAVGRENEVDLIKLSEDTALSGFTPLMFNPQDPCYADKSEDMEVAQMCLRIQKILFFGEVFLCGLETPVLKLQKSECGLSEYVSVVEASSSGSPSSPPEQSDSELLVESYSEDENDETSSTRIPRSSSESWPGSQSSIGAVPAGEIRSLIERKEELERRQRKQERHRQRVQAILKKSTVSVEIEVRPRLLVPDTNCFIDYLPQLQCIARATSGTQPLYTLMIPLVVLNELEGLARGGDARDCPPASRAALNPEHISRVAESSKIALAFARSRNPAIKCLTTRGTVLTSSTFTIEEDVSQDGLTRNDDRILATCLSLCKCGANKDHGSSEETEPRRLRREVVLLTEDRNLRVKALARDVPVREVPDFIRWAGLG